MGWQCSASPSDVFVAAKTEQQNHQGSKLPLEIVGCSERGLGQRALGEDAVGGFESSAMIASLGPAVHLDRVALERC